VRSRAESKAAVCVNEGRVESSTGVGVRMRGWIFGNRVGWRDGHKLVCGPSWLFGVVRGVRGERGVW
jgi:hypothetical protein